MPNSKQNLSSIANNLTKEEKFFINQKLEDPLYKHVWEKPNYSYQSPTDSSNFKNNNQNSKENKNHSNSNVKQQKDYENIYKELGFLNYEINDKLQLNTSSQNNLNYHETIVLEEYNNIFEIDKAIDFLLKEKNITLTKDETILYTGSYTFVICQLDSQGEVIYPLKIKKKITMSRKKTAKQLREQIKN